MTDRLQAIINLLVLVIPFCYCVFRMIRAWHRHGFLYGMKYLIGSIQCVTAFFLAIYALIISSFLLGSFIKYWDVVFKPHASDFMGEFIYATTPLALVIMIVIIVFSLLIIGNKPLWKLNEEEKQYENGLKKAYTLKVSKYPKIIRWFLLN